MSFTKASPHGFHTVWTKFKVDKSEYSCTLCDRFYKLNTSTHPSTTLAMRHLRDRHHEAYEEVVRAERKRKAIIKIRGRSSRGCKQDYLEPLVEPDLLDDEEGATLKSEFSSSSFT